MKSLWIRSILPVLVFSMLSACAKKDDSGAKRVNSSVPQEQPKKETSETQKDGVKLPAAGAGTDSTMPKLPEDVGQDDKGTVDGKVVVDDNKDQNQTTVDQQNSGPKKIGSKYSSAGNDYFRDHLTAKMDAVENADIRKRNQAAANSVTDVQVSVDRETRDVLVVVTTKKAKKTENIRLGGSIDDDGITDLVLASGQGITGRLICLDRSASTCFNTHIRLEIGEKGNKSVVNIISRKTSANFDYKFPINFAGNREFRKLVDLFDNTERDLKKANSLRNILVESFEVIHGRSGVTLSMISREGEVIMASGALLASKDGGVLTNVDLSLKDLNFSRLTDLQKGKTFKTAMHHSISSARLIGNDGNKELTVAFTVRPDQNGVEETLIVTFIRQHTSIKTLTQVEELLK